MSDVTTGGRPVSISIPSVDFMKGMRGAKSQAAYDANTNLMTSVNVPLFSGKDLADDMRSQFPGGGKIDLNLGKLSDMPAGLLNALGTTQKAPCNYTGNTPDEKPVTITTVRNLSVQDPKQRDTVKLTIDMQAVANVNDIERDMGREAKGLDKYITGDPKVDRKNPALGRIPVTLSAPNSVNGVTGICADSMKHNLGQMAAQNYLMTASKSSPDASMVKKEAVATIGDLYMSELTNFVKTYAEKGCTGIMPSEKQADGTYKAAKGKNAEPIKGTSFKSFKDMGIAPVFLDNGGVVLACVDGSEKAANNRKGPDGLVAVNKAFNSYMSQKVNGSFEKKSPELNLGNSVSIQLYQTTAPGDDSVTLIQPSVALESRPYGSAVTRSIESATHQNTKPVEELYGKEVLDNTRKIQDYFPEKTDAEQKSKVMEEVNEKLSQKGLTACKSYEAAQRGASNDGPNY